ncbi:MAG: elongation factor P maturation arginine rhamnosyltransferase EarP [Chitinispirillaceae bacterium]|jgi:uncharacterized repeat protein (TIGR03837 family)|nr:elongation factor P maturation arginine rhamnosyltransferase EarP [Chitinispirillaceae bacterium]
MQFQSVDIFCHVVDNFGDIGFVYRFAREFKACTSGCALRVFVDDLQTFRTIKPEIDPSLLIQSHDGIEYIATGALTTDLVCELDVADVLIEAFACRIPESVFTAAQSRKRVIINLEHLSAEDWVEGYHCKESLLPVKSLRKYFFMPGFTKDTGGLLLDRRIERCKPKLARCRRACLTGLLRAAGHTDLKLDDVLIGTVFTYLRGFDRLLSDLNGCPRGTILLAFGHKSVDGMVSSIKRAAGRQISEQRYQCGNVTILVMPFIPQPRYDTLLCLVDFNIVRGEDSLVRALLAGKPFIWNAYLQDNNYQKVKVEAFLDRFRDYFSDRVVFDRYRELLLQFNDSPSESPLQVTGERYQDFFQSLEKIEQATKEMSYFTNQNCDLIQKLKAFLDNL